MQNISGNGGVAREGRRLIFGVMLLCGLLGGGCDRSASQDGASVSDAAGDPNTLVIMSPHNQDIRNEFERVFVETIGRDVEIKWIVNGTRDLIEQATQANDGEGGWLGADLFFGGGIPDFETLIERGLSAPVTLSDEVLEPIPATAGGLPTRHPEGKWFGAAFAGFGILVNSAGVADQGLPPVAGWETLAEPSYYGWVALADPRRSASVAMCYELVLQQHGWEDGWPLLMQIAANSRVIASSSSAVPNSVAAGETLAGPAIDFFARPRVEAGGGRLAYLAPKGGTAITPDPIGMLSGARNPELGKEFMEFVLSEAGQRLWMLPTGAEGGPKGRPLYRLPVLPMVYDTYEAAVETQNPYDLAMPFDLERQTARQHLLKVLFGVALVDLDDELRGAWKAMTEAGQPEAALAEWRRLPFNEAEAMQLSSWLKSAAVGSTDDQRDVRAKQREWRTFFEAKYDRVLELSRS